MSRSMKSHISLQLSSDVGLYGFRGEVGMVITYREALAELGSRYRVRKAVSEGTLHPVGRGMYSTNRDEDALAVIAKRYPGGILTGQTALYAHGLVTAPPDRIDLATKRGGTKIRDAAVRQHFIPEGWLGVGRSTVSVDGTELAAYDPERMLLELMRSRNKLPYDLYREAVASFRRRSERLDIYRLQDYAEAIPQGTPRARHGGGILMDLNEMRARYEREEGYSCLNATARVCQDVILSKLAASGMRDRVTVKGGVLMCALSGSGRRATQDIDLDFVRYPMTDASIRSFVSALSNLGDGVTVRIAGEIEELSQQDYKGRRVNLKVSDGRSTFDTKLDLGVHASAAMEQDELWFDVAHRQEGVCLLANSKEQVFAEKLKSLLRHGIRTAPETRFMERFMENPPNLATVQSLLDWGGREPSRQGQLSGGYSCLDLEPLENLRGVLSQIDI